MILLSVGGFLVKNHDSFSFPESEEELFRLYRSPREFSLAWVVVPRLVAVGRDICHTRLSYCTELL